MNTRKIINIFIIIAIIGVLACCVVAIILRMNGSTTIVKSDEADLSSETLTCESSSILYPIFSYDNSRTKKLIIISNFYGGKLNAISLEYTLYYDSADLITASEAHNHASMNKSFANSGLNPDSFSVNYAKMNDSLRTTLYVEGSDLNSASLKYFMIEDDVTLSSLANYQKNYESQGFICKENN